MVWRTPPSWLRAWRVAPPWLAPWRAGRAPSAALVVALVAGLSAAPVADAADEAELKAAIVYNLLMFVEWPADATPAMGSTLVLCLQPESRYGAALKVLAERPLRGLRVQLRDVAPAAPAVATACNALLVEDDAAERLPQLARALKGSSVLVIADGANVGAEPVTISLKRGDNKVAFDLNLASARRARLTLSSKLMRLAREVVE